MSSIKNVLNLLSKDEISAWLIQYKPMFRFRALKYSGTFTWNGPVTVVSK